VRVMHAVPRVGAIVRAVVALAVSASAAAAAGPAGGGTQTVRRHLSRCIPPVVASQPASQAIAAGQGATLSVTATGSPTLGFQWYLGGAGDSSLPISGATSASYATGALATTASFWVRVSNGCGHADSLAAVVTVTAPQAITIYLGGSNTVPLELVPIPAGTFTMGSPDGERARNVDEGPQHLVTITQLFYLGRTEVTQAQWQAVMGSNPSFFTNCGGTCPVERASWNDICGGATGSNCAPSSFIGKLNQQQGTAKFRLPTEAEWEYAARAGTTSEFSFPVPPGWDVACGTFPQAALYMWWCNNSGSTTHPVGGKGANPWGLLDMHGNVWEWVGDWYGAYPATPETDPQGPASSYSRVVRGGTWNLPPGYCRSARRSYFVVDQHYNAVGFRLARSQ
jgi:formylglycine-generating enzyme required for sulfatase activity